MRIMDPNVVRLKETILYDEEFVSLGRKLREEGFGLGEAVAEAKARLESDCGYLERRIEQHKKAISFLERLIEESKVCHRSFSSRVWIRRLEKVQTEKERLEGRFRTLKDGRK